MTNDTNVNTQEIVLSINDLMDAIEYIKYHARARRVKRISGSECGIFSFNEKTGCISGRPVGKQMMHEDISVWAYMKKKKEEE